ncbi:phage tail protein [Enterobacterales bacterium CwR94]|nr:phage tail protein [Enterobacterales bacterium CwR94]
MTISFNAIPANINVPVFYAEMDNSAANTAQEGGKSLLIGYTLPDAPLEPHRLTLMPTAAQAQKEAGQGSQLARMVAAYRSVDPFGELWVIALKPSDAGVAKGGVLLAGSPTAAGNLNVYIGRSRVQIAVAAAEPMASIAQSLADKINALADLPVTAKVDDPAEDDDGSQRQLTLTAKYGGTLGNGIPLTLNYYGSGSGEILPAGLNVTLTAFTGGAGDADLSPVVAAMGDEPFDFIGSPFSDASALRVLSMEMNDDSGRWSYARQIYGHVYTAKVGSLSELVAFGDGFNDQHLTIAGYENTVQTPVEELVALRLARDAVFIRNDPARPTQTGELNGALPAPAGRRFTLTEQQTLLDHGIATATAEGNRLMIQRDVTTYKVNAYGVKDNSYFDSETLHTSAYVLRRLRSVITSKYGRHKLANDGTRFGPGQAIVTPSVIRGELCAVYRAMERDGIVESFETFKKYLIVERNAANPNRLDVLFPPDYVNQLRVFALLNQFRLQYTEEEA